MSRARGSRSKEGGNQNLRCTCGRSESAQNHASLDVNNQQKSTTRSTRNSSRSRNEESTFDLSINDDVNYDASFEDSTEDEFYDASGDNSSYMRKSDQSVNYDASFEDSMSKIDHPSFNAIEFEFNDPSQNFEEIIPSRSRSRQRSKTRSPSQPRVSNVRRNLFNDQSNENELMNASERTRRNAMHEMLNEESYMTANESLLDVEDDPSNAHILGYIYRVDSFR